MAIRLEIVYTTRAQAASADYPGGSFKNSSAPGVKDGTPLEIAWANDKEGMFQALLARAIFSPNGDEDTAIASQYLDAARAVIGGTLPQLMTPHALCSEDGSCQINSPTEEPNVVQLPAQVRGSCIGLDIRVGGTGKPCLFTAHVDATIRLTNFPHEYIEGTVSSDELVIAFPDTPEEVCGICCDGTNLYISWYATAGDVKVSAFALATVEGAALWTVDTGESADGLSSERSQMIMADHDHIAIMLAGSPTYPNTNASIGIINTATQAIAIGTGSYVSGTADLNHGYKMVTDRTHVYWMGKQQGSGVYDFYLLSAKITDPTTSDYATKQIADSLDAADVWTWPKALSVVRGNPIMAAPNGIFWMFRTDTGAIWKQYDFSFSFLPSGLGQAPDGDCMLGFDNLNMWFITPLNSAMVTDGFWVAFKIPLGYFSQYISAASEFEMGSIPFLVIDSESIDTTVSIGGRLHFDGRDMEFVTRNGSVFRITAPGLR
jgi:hypothetical protein